MTEVHVIGGNLAYPGKAPDPAKYPFTTAQCGRANVTTTWLGFVKIWRGTGEVFDMVDLFLPPVTYMTQVSISC
jgi:DEAD/DEAH box helicase domain-containing protein